MKTIYVKRDERGTIFSALEHETGQAVETAVKTVVEANTAIEKGIKEGQEVVDCIFRKVRNDHRLKGWLGRINSAVKAISKGADGADLDLLIELKTAIEKVQSTYNTRHNL